MNHDLVDIIIKYNNFKKEISILEEKEKNNIITNQEISEKIQKEKELNNFCKNSLTELNSFLEEKVGFRLSPFKNDKTFNSSFNKIQGIVRMSKEEFLNSYNNLVNVINNFKNNNQINDQEYKILLNSAALIKDYHLQSYNENIKVKLKDKVLNDNSNIKIPSFMFLILNVLLFYIPILSYGFGWNSRTAKIDIPFSLFINLFGLQLIFSSCLFSIIFIKYCEKKYKSLTKGDIDRYCNLYLKQNIVVGILAFFINLAWPFLALNSGNPFDMLVFIVYFVAGMGLAALSLFYFMFGILTIIFIKLSKAKIKVSYYICLGSFIMALLLFLVFVEPKIRPIVKYNEETFDEIIKTEMKYDYTKSCFIYKDNLYFISFNPNNLLSRLIRYDLEGKNRKVITETDKNIGFYNTFGRGDYIYLNEEFKININNGNLEPIDDVSVILYQDTITNDIIYGTKLVDGTFHFGNINLATGVSNWYKIPNNHTTAKIYDHLYGDTYSVHENNIYKNNNIIYTFENIEKKTPKIFIQNNYLYSFIDNELYKISLDNYNLISIKTYDESYNFFKKSNYDKNYFLTKNFLYQFDDDNLDFKKIIDYNYNIRKFSTLENYNIIELEPETKKADLGIVYYFSLVLHDWKANTTTTYNNVVHYNYDDKYLYLISINETESTKNEFPAIEYKFEKIDLYP